MTDQEKTKLLQLISNNRIQEVINALLVMNWPDEQKKTILAIAAQFKKLKQQGSLGILHPEEERLTENQIVVRLIDFINAPEESTDPIIIPDPPKPKVSPSNKVLKTIGLLGSIASIIALLLFFLPPDSDKTLQLTVFVSDTNGNAVLEQQGRLNIPLGNRALNEVIGVNGRTNFPDITANNKGDTITIGLEAKGWKIVGKNTFVFTGAPIRLTVKRDDSLGTIKGVVKNRNGQEFIQGALVRINTDTTVLTDDLGIFKLILPERMRVKEASQTYELTVSKEGYVTTSEYHLPNETGMEIRLEKR